MAGARYHPTPDSSLEDLLARSWLRAGAELRRAWPAPTRLSADELALLAVQQRYCVLATVTKRGQPRALPVSFALDPTGCFWLPTVAGAARLADVRANPHAAITVGQGMGGVRAALIASGPAEILAADHIPAPLLAIVAGKLGDLSWLGHWIVVRPERLLGYGSRQETQSEGKSNRSPG